MNVNQTHSSNPEMNAENVIFSGTAVPHKFELIKGNVWITVKIVITHSNLTNMGNTHRLTFLMVSKDTKPMKMQKIPSVVIRQSFSIQQ